MKLGILQMFSKLSSNTSLHLLFIVCIFFIFLMCCFTSSSGEQKKTVQNK